MKGNAIRQGFSSWFLIFSVAETQYFLKDNKGLCDQNEMIGTQAECTEAILQLQSRGLHLTFGGTSGSNPLWPKGCYRHTGDNFGYWNSAASGESNINARPICKGKWIETIKINYLEI